MHCRPRVCLWVFVSLALTPWPVSGQSRSTDAPPPPPAHLAAVDGEVTLDRDGLREPASIGLSLISGDRLRTVVGRAEAVFTDGSALHLDQATTIDLLANDLVRLVEGRISLWVAGARHPQQVVPYQVDAPSASVQVLGPGQYRISADQGEVVLAVVSGGATLATDVGAVTVRAGEMAFAQDGRAPSPPQYFNSARWDAFDRWCAARLDARLGTRSVQYLPSELQIYSGVFDRYGTWQVEPDVGDVWVPAVAADWRPYYYGYWRPYPAWGPVWVGFDPWAYATHHYGRWGFSLRVGWYWMPVPGWGPGWVYWGSSVGYVSWCPMGRHGGPVFAQWGLHGARFPRPVDPWQGWTVVPRRVYGTRTPVHTVAVDGRRLPPESRGVFVGHRAPPPLDRAVPRGWASRGTPASPQPGTPGVGAGSPAVPYANIGNGDAAVRRFGRRDGTGIERPPAAPEAGVAGVPRARRTVPGSVGSDAPADTPPSAGTSVVGRTALDDRRQTGRWTPTPGTAWRRPTPSDATGAPPTPSAVIDARPRPSEVMRGLPTPSDALGIPARRSWPSWPAGEAQVGRERETPRDVARPREMPPSSGTPYARQPPSSAERMRVTPPAYGAPASRSAPSDHDRPRTSAAPAREPRAPGSAPRYNRGTERSSGGAPSGAARTRPSRHP